ncbi:MAG: DUF11 domain-containing protein [Rhodanobacteraceae bacterium]|jgi:uncharacterized repeat protein (TIGR01451 family)|nr:DUF11 domain-containing protein [Rhodanobacteraceae bacterium]
MKWSVAKFARVFHFLFFSLCAVVAGAYSPCLRAVGFLPMPSLATPRSNHTATPLADGRVLVAGGWNSSSGYLSATELYDPTTNTWLAGAPLSPARYGQSAVVLRSGKVLVTGGRTANGIVATTELYDPVTDTWSLMRSMSKPRASHTATLLADGRVLACGGDSGLGYLASCERYDPTINIWMPTAVMSTARMWHSATLLPSGSVLVVGGKDAVYLNSAEIYDPVADTFRPTASLETPRNGHTDTLLPSGRVLVTGGGNAGGYVDSVEIYDPFVGAWLTAPRLSTPRIQHTATLLSSGKVLIVGGAFGVDLNSAELYDPARNAWMQAGTLNQGRYAHSATLLGGDRVLMIGGTARNGYVSSVELYAPATQASIEFVTPNATVVGQGYMVGFKVTSPTGAPTGQAMVDDGQGSSCGPVVLTNGTGSCSLPSTEAGGFVLTATYTPDSGAFAPSSATAHHAVNRAATTLAIVGHAPERTTPAQPVTVAAALAVVSPGAGTPSGPITVGDGVDSCTIADGATQCALVLATRGPRTLTAHYVGDGNFIDSSAQVEHHVNRLPVAGAASYATSEDSALSVPATLGVLAHASDPDGDALTVANAGTLTASGIGGTVVLQADGGFAYTPPPYAHGTATFDYTVSDGFETISATATITVSFVNQAPHFALEPLPKWPAGASGARTQAGFATVTDFGAPNEADQHVLAWHLRPLGDPNGIVSNVALALDGTLSYTLSGRAGSATFGVRLQDDGGTANGGHDTSDEQTFTISVAAGVDLSISIGNDSEFVAGGSPVEYTILVHNAGPNDAVGAKVRDLLPSNLVDAAWSCSATAGAACMPAGIGDIDDTVTIPAGASLTYRLIATVVADPEATVEQTVSVSAPEGVPDLDPTNNTATRRNAVGVFFDGFDRQFTPTAMDA